MSNHKNFVSSVCVLGDGEWICTGSNDATICVYAMNSIEPFTILRGHSATGKLMNKKILFFIKSNNIFFIL